MLRVGREGFARDPDELSAPYFPIPSQVHHSNLEPAPFIELHLTLNALNLIRGRAVVTVQGFDRISRVSYMLLPAYPQPGSHAQIRAFPLVAKAPVGELSNDLMSDEEGEFEFGRRVYFDR